MYSLGRFISALYMARWPSGKAEACKAFIPGSNPGLASNERKGHPTGCPFAMRRCDKRGEPVCTGAGKNSPLRGVGESRILVPALAGLAQLVARHLAKVEVAGSNPVARSMYSLGRFISALYMARWPSGKAEACKAFIPGSNPGLASNARTGHLPRQVPFSLRIVHRRRSQRKRPRPSRPRRPRTRHRDATSTWTLPRQRPWRPRPSTPCCRT